jgi:hypothetical protein
VSELSTPEEALSEARRRATAARTAGEYADADRLPSLPRPEPTNLGRLYEWALIEISPDEIRSNRRLGAPITALKRLLGRLLRQYHNELSGHQSRFNYEALVYIAHLERRVAELERRADGRDSS